jgi:[acyl-carrier-protein] S-malonyltransferase
MGHSLGEYTALVVKDCISFEDAVWLVVSHIFVTKRMPLLALFPSKKHNRGKLVQIATNQSPFPTNMMAIIHMEPIDSMRVMETIEKMRKCENPSTYCCDIAAINSEKQWVLSGFANSLQKTIDLLKKGGIISNAVKLPVSAPFHSSIMKSVLDDYSKILDKIRFKLPSTNSPCNNIISNVTGSKVSFNHTEEIKSLLLQHLYSTVQWKNSLEYALEKSLPLNGILEIGPGKVLLNLLSSINISSHVRKK